MAGTLHQLAVITNQKGGHIIGMPLPFLPDFKIFRLLFFAEKSVKCTFYCSVITLLVIEYGLAVSVIISPCRRSV